MRSSRSAPGALVCAVFAAFGFGCSPAQDADTNQETEAPGERECFACDGQRECVAQSCSQIVSDCWGPAYFDGANAGACGPVLDCLETCPCTDDACEMACFADAPVECLSCTTQLRQCEQAMCAPQDACPDMT